MNQMPRLALSLSLIVGLGGCPIFGSGGSDGDGYCDPSYGDCYSPCYVDSDCGSNGYCDNSGYCHQYPGTGGSGPSSTASTSSSSPTSTGSTSSTGGAGPTYCGNPDDCQAGETCAPDTTCHPGDCVANGCIYGFVCDLTASPPACVSESPTACGSDSDCASDGAGYKCVSGNCTAPADQCFDGTQCAPGDVCADGKCTPSCSNDTCSTPSYTCSAVDTCTVPTQPCNITNDCGGPDAVCVDGACVPRSPDGTCDTGSVWVENGCIPNQSATFVCSIDGTQDVCAAGSLCLHHSCFISCEPPNQNACSGLPDFNQCKSVNTTSGAHSVCGSSDNLGGQCDPTAGQECGGALICIDGFCH